MIFLDKTVDLKLYEDKEGITLQYVEQSFSPTENTGVTLYDKYKISIMQYVLKKRMNLAKELLKNKNNSITKVSLECGFSDIEYFSRTFKNETGLSPTKWREQKEAVAK
jgi:AraC-like DNA-binding protein